MRADSSEEAVASIQEPQIFQPHRVMMSRLGQDVSIEPIDSHQDAEDLPSQLIISKGDYRIGTKVYPLRSTGRLLAADPLLKAEARIVKGEELIEMLSAFSYLHTHGHRDDALSIEEMSQKAASGKLVATCGPSSLWLASNLRDLGFRARLVSSATADEWNTFDNGHTLIEVFSTSHDRWVAYDITSNSLILGETQPLHLLEIAERIQGNRPLNVLRIATDALYDFSSVIDLNPGSKALASYTESILTSSSAQIEWYKRVLQVPLHYSEGYWWTFDEVTAQRFSNQNVPVKLLSEGAWVLRFYGANVRDEPLPTLSPHPRIPSLSASSH